MKRFIPNILTTYRLIVALLIPVLFFTSHYNIFTILFITALLSDSFDGALARKWNVTSNYGKIADVIGDKLLSFSASTTFIIAINKAFIITLFFELAISINNIIIWIKNGGIKNRTINNKSSIYGKIKTWFLFVSLAIGFISCKYIYMKKFIIPLIIATSIMQLITLINYIKKKE